MSRKTRYLKLKENEETHTTRVTVSGSEPGCSGAKLRLQGLSPCERRVGRRDYRYTGGKENRQSKNHSRPYSSEWRATEQHHLHREQARSRFIRGSRPARVCPSAFHCGLIGRGGIPSWRMRRGRSKLCEFRS